MIERPDGMGYMLPRYIPMVGTYVNYKTEVQQYQQSVVRVTSNVNDIDGQVQ